MSARVLVVDDIEANRKLLEAKLSHEYFQVDTGINGQEAVDKALELQPDIILLDVMMPVMNGFEACKLIKSNSDTEHIPVVMVTALGDRDNRLQGLEAGADDFLTKPVDDFALMSRVRALTKYKLVIDELRTREASGRRMGVIDKGDNSGAIDPARILLVDDNTRQAHRLALALKEEHKPVTLEEAGGFAAGPQSGVDLILLSLHAKTFDPLRMCAHFKSSAHTRDLPVLAIADSDEENMAVKALDLGASDVILRPIDTEELSARVRTQVRKKRYLEAMRRRLDESMELAITDQLTGLFNRRHMTNQLEQFLSRANRGGEPLSVFIADIDHFKSVNDTHGHDVGDEVLREFAQRIKRNIRPSDIPCRQGGEEFTVIMPNTDSVTATQVAERVRADIAAKPFYIQNGRQALEITVSVGVSTIEPPNDSIDGLMRRADAALYAAKEMGRNRVVPKAA